MNQWKQDRQIKSKSLNKKSKNSFSIKETAEFLLESEIQLKSEGYTQFSWSYDSGWHDDGFQVSEDKTLWVSGSRPATDEEQSQYEAQCREQTIKRIRESIQSIAREISSNEKKLVDLNSNLVRFTKELETNSNRKSDIKSVTKAISRREEWIIDLKEKRKLYEPLLSLSEEEMVSEFRRIDKEEYEKKYGTKVLA